jgi:predicted transcriptional regulator
VALPQGETAILLGTPQTKVYNAMMMPKLSEDQREALRNHPSGSIVVEDEQTQQRYVLVERGIHERAMQALQQQEDLAAIPAGINDMEAGNVVTFEEVDARIRAKLGIPPRS